MKTLKDYIGQWLRTRDGRDAFVACHVPPLIGNETIVGYIDGVDGRNLCTWYEDGCSFKCKESGADLIIPKPDNKVWVNVYRVSKTWYRFSDSFDTEKKAKSDVGDMSAYIKTIQIDLGEIG